MGSIPITRSILKAAINLIDIRLIAGVISALILDVGMCCPMVWSGALFVPGVIIGTVGIIGVSLAYPLDARITQRETSAPEIMRLTDELWQQ